MKKSSERKIRRKKWDVSLDVVSRMTMMMITILIVKEEEKWNPMFVYILIQVTVCTVIVNNIDNIIKDQITVLVDIDLHNTMEFNYSYFQQILDKSISERKESVKITIRQIDVYSAGCLNEYFFKQSIEKMIDLR